MREKRRTAGQEFDRAASTSYNEGPVPPPTALFPQKGEPAVPATVFAKPSDDGRF
jgi:hypothetical protein